MKAAFITILFLLSTLRSTAQFAVGLEQDALPYVLKGFIGTVWFGEKHLRTRVSYAHAYSPKLVLQKDITQEKTIAVGVSSEFFLKENFKGLWFGPGIGYWEQQVKSVNSTAAHRFQSAIFSLGGGYNIYLWRNLYFTPWVAAHFRVTGNGKQDIDGVAYTPMSITPEASVKLGWKIGK
jgi:hypothetical protein